MIATKLRPENLEEFVGQPHLRTLLEKLIQTQDKSSFIFYGPSGTGKTSLAILLAKNLNLKFDIFNATIENKSDLLQKIKDNQVVIIDEVHRLNKDKQDILLSHLEQGETTFYLCTTENPFFKIVPAIRSRTYLLEFKPLSFEDIFLRLSLYLKNNNLSQIIDDSLLKFIIRHSNGDLRQSLNNLSLILKLNKKKNIEKEDIKAIIPSMNFYSDEKGDNHYDYLSAFHKSLRGSDEDASLYYGAIILHSGDIDGLIRRLIAVVHEDIGLANPLLSIKVQSAIWAMERLGMPEMKLPLAHIICEIALSPKSNSTYLAFEKAQELINSNQIYTPPNHLRDSYYQSAAKLNRGVGYKYPHDFENHWIFQQYMPDKLKNQVLFTYSNSQAEVKFKKYWDNIKKNEGKNGL
ncbi:replication-associated recombination protein A [Mycoplasma hyorhinis]|uniref:replication-associated recombination protein A n=1 Tax=Mesomycoplasma hyorhinis TaxID=2100 RepID=UPI00136DDE34|nr:replication-associated recombination protein A [Mesomycoplasma hyorhinis]MXR06282.1 replication-associated recombination protein A [Mesomycoplasma hyorhinis]